MGVIQHQNELTVIKFGIANIKTQNTVLQLFQTKIAITQ